MCCESLIGRIHIDRFSNLHPGLGMVQVAAVSRTRAGLAPSAIGGMVQLKGQKTCGRSSGLVDVPRRRPLRRVFEYNRSPDASVRRQGRKIGIKNNKNRVEVSGVSHQKRGDSNKYVGCNLDLDNDLEDITAKRAMNSK